jgi:Response regulator of the LytR/AlgR family
MIRVSIKSPRYNDIKNIFQLLLKKENLKLDFKKLDLLRAFDIYVIEIDSYQELGIISEIKKQSDTLLYVIGPKDFDIVNECIRLNVHLYIRKDDIKDEMLRYRKDISKHIQDRFQYYEYKRNGIYSQIRLSQIYYIESIRHSIIIHSINGDFVERKNLSCFLEEIASSHFIQIHKSFIINDLQINKKTNKDVTLKDGTILPIGRVYKTIFLDKMSNDK